LDIFYQENQQRQLEDVAKKLKNFLINAGRKNTRAVDTAFMKGLGNEDIWCVDLIEPVYRRLAAGIIKMAVNLRDLEERTDMKTRTDSLESSQPHHRRPREAEARRPDRVLLPWL
jgi:hypothetical protein